MSQVIARPSPAAPLNLDRDPIDVVVGNRLRVARTARRVSLEKLGSAIGVTYQQVQKYETGANRLSVGTLMRICTALACDPSTILPPTDSAAPDTSLPLDAVRVINAIRDLPTGTGRTIVLRHVQAILDTAQ